MQNNPVTFEEWWELELMCEGQAEAEGAWDYQQARIVELERYINWVHEWTSHIVPTFEVWQKKYKNQ